MEFKKLIEELESLKLPHDEYAVTSSGSMAARGIREANDLDLVVTKKLWKILTKKFKVENNGFSDKIHITENIEAYVPSSPSIAREFIDNADTINGIRFVNLQVVKSRKQKWGREKDLDDVKLIEKYLLKNHE